MSIILLNLKSLTQPNYQLFNMNNLQTGVDGQQWGQLSVAQGQPVKLTVNENPTTGYEWTMTANECGTRLTSLGDTYTRSASNDMMMGAGGVKTFSFQAASNAAGNCNMRFVLKRPWEQDMLGAPEKFINVNFRPL